MLRHSYSKEEVKKVIERKKTNLVPLAFHKFWGEGLYEKYGKDLDEVSEDIPDDVLLANFIEPGIYESSIDDPDYLWAFQKTPKSEKFTYDSKVLLDDWLYLDNYLKEFPNIKKHPEVFDNVKELVKENKDKYILGYWWLGFFERFWFIRGMENALTDFIINPKETKILLEKILEYNLDCVRSFSEAGVDGILISDDLGSQQGLLFSPSIFKKYLKQLYKDFINEIHKLNMHFWLHSCGNIFEIIDDFIAVGVDVIHPIQANTMDYFKVAQYFKGNISFLIGFDVQHLLIEGTVHDIKSRIKDIANIFGSNKGGLLLGAGNGILPGTPLKNIRAFLEQATFPRENNNF